MRKLSILILLLALPAAAAGAGWPSLERQLADDRVPTGSALARLIEDSQDFELLRPEEAADTLPVPPWLRVLWRRAHPEAEYRPDDPTGGYPFALKEIHEWLVSHPDLERGDGPEPVYEAVVSAAGPNTRISGAIGNPRSETDVRVNYWDPSKVVAASNDIRGGGALAVFSSIDFGTTWRHTSLPIVGADSFHSDPTVDWTSDGTAWATSLSIDFVQRKLVIHAYRSRDFGATWTFDAEISGGHRLADKQMIWVDHNDASPFKDNLYVIWHNGPYVFLNRRAGGAWGAPVQVSGRETTGTGIGADVKTNSLGHAFGFWPDTGSGKIFVVRSIDGGASWSRPAQAGRTFGRFDIGIPAQVRRRVLIYVTGGAFYRGPRKNMVYAAWTDLAGGRTCQLRFQEPRANAQSPCKTRIWFARSSDGGRRWTAPRMIWNQPRTLNDQFNPWLVVDETSGNLAIMYYDTAFEGRTRTNVWYQASFNDGATWSAPFKVTTESSDASVIGANGNQYGDYNGMSGIAGRFYPVWTDRRGGREEAWTAPLVEAGPPPRRTAAGAGPGGAGDRSDEGRGAERGGSGDAGLTLSCPVRFLLEAEDPGLEQLLQPVCALDG